MNRKFIAAVFLAAITLICFWPVKNFEFLNYDDGFYVTENAQVKKGFTWANLGRGLTDFNSFFQHSLPRVLYSAFHHFFGLNPEPYHLLNLVLHVLNALLVFWILCITTTRIFESWFAAALFALHPFQVESVAWISELKGVLGAFFWLLSILAYIRYTHKGSHSNYFLSWVFFAMALMSKSVTMMLPLTLLPLDFWPLKRMMQRKAFWGLVREKIPFFILVPISAAFEFRSQFLGGAIVPFSNWSFDARMINVVHAYIRYLGKVIWPVKLSVFYPRPEFLEPSSFTVLSFFLLVLATIICLRTLHRFPYLWMGWLWYLGTLLPTIGFIQVGAHEMADRYVYVPLIGIFIAGTWLFFDLLNQFRFGKVCAVIFFGFMISRFAAVTCNQLLYWRSSTDLFKHAIQVTKENWLAHNNLGEAYFKRGKLDEASEQFRQAIRIKPHLSTPYNNLGVLLMEQKKYEEARENFNLALKNKPRYADAYFNLGLLEKRLGNLEEAKNYFSKAKHAAAGIVIWNIK